MDATKACYGFTSILQESPLLIQQGEGQKRYQSRYQRDAQFHNNMRQYYRLITGMDIIIGKVINKLKMKNLLNNTIIVFSSDNGLLTGEYGLAGKMVDVRRFNSCSLAILLTK